MRVRVFACSGRFFGVRMCVVHVPIVSSAQRSLRLFDVTHYRYQPGRLGIDVYQLSHSWVSIGGIVSFLRWVHSVHIGVTGIA